LEIHTSTGPLKVPCLSPGIPHPVGVPNEPVSLTPGIAFFIGHAFVKWIQSKGLGSSSASPIRISVGRDPRISGPVMEQALVSGLATAGAEVHTFGIATTPCMFYSIVEGSGRKLGSSLTICTCALALICSIV
jgi:hypothetical protein